jgi:hypothetical protein
MPAAAIALPRRVKPPPAVRRARAGSTATFLIHQQGEPALVLAAGHAGRVERLGKALEAETANPAKTLPLGVTLTKIIDQAVNIRAAVDEFMLKFLRRARRDGGRDGADSGVPAGPLRGLVPRASEYATTHSRGIKWAKLCRRPA